MQTVNPTTGEPGRTFPTLTDDELNDRVARAARAFPSWSRAPLAERVKVVARAGELLDQEAPQLGALMTQEMGKLVGAGRQEAQKCAAACRYYAEHAERFLRPEVVTTTPTEHGEIRYEALGPVLAVMPWNFPFWQVIRFAAPALVAGNVGLLKHASNVPQCALALEDLFTRAGAPAGVFQTLLIESGRVAGVIADERVAAVTVTGSESAGREVAAVAGRHLKKTVLELGGSDPFIVLPSADLARAIATGVKARLVSNSGQSCIAAKRFIVADAVYDRFADGFVAAMKALQVGDPMQPDTEVGPLATRGILDGLAAQVDRTVAAGARLLTGGHRLPGPGNFYAPTVLADIPRQSPAFGEELFGPVASLFRVRDLSEAITLANATGFGLGASAWTREPAEIDRLTRDLEAGSVFINDLVASDPRFPFGGVKRSGYGRELAVHGLREFVNVKTVRIKTGPPA